MKHICVGNLTIIGSDNGLLPDRRQAIIWTNAGLLLIGPIRTHFSEIWIEILTFSFKKMHLKISSGKWRPFCLGLNVLNCRNYERLPSSTSSIRNIVVKLLTSTMMMNVNKSLPKGCWSGHVLYNERGLFHRHELAKSTLSLDMHDFIDYRKVSNIRRTKSQNLKLLVSSWSSLYPIRWSQVLSWEWRCSWSSADRRCSNYIWVINNLIAY